MEIQNDTQGKWIRSSYNCFLVNSSATEDTDKVVAMQVYVPLHTSIDEYVEITAEEAERIKKAKDAQKGNVVYPETEVNQIIGLFANKINDIDLTDEQALQYKNLYPKWETFINQKLSAGYKVLYNDKLYKVKQDIETVLENQFPSVDTAALYEEINEKNKGTFDDPIPYNNNMQLFEGKYYIQDSVIYKCTRNTEQAVYNNLADLVDIYVIIATE